MIKGIYTSASGMIPRIKQQEITANNIANVSTPGFKRDRIFAKELSRAEVKKLPQKNDWQRPMVNRVYTDYNQGIFDKTGNPLDVAIDGDGMFKLQMQDGTTVLTRSGSFTVNRDGLLSFPGGALVMGESGPIQVGSGTVSVSQAGDIEVDGGRVGKLVPVTVADLTELNKIGGSFYIVPEDAELIPVEKYSIQQGFLEASNVDIVSEMIDMIVAFREYEAGAKSIQAQDQTLENLFRRVGGGS